MVCSAEAEMLGKGRNI